MRKGAIIVLAVLMAALLVSQVDAFRIKGPAAGTLAAATGTAVAGNHATVTVVTAEQSKASDSCWKESASTKGFAAVRAVACGPVCEGGAAATASAITVGGAKA